MQVVSELQELLSALDSDFAGRLQRQQAEDEQALRQQAVREAAANLRPNSEGSAPTSSQPPSAAAAAVQYVGYGQAAQATFHGSRTAANDGHGVGRSRRLSELPRTPPSHSADGSASKDSDAGAAALADAAAITAAATDAPHQHGPATPPARIGATGASASRISSHPAAGHADPVALAGDVDGVQLVEAWRPTGRGRRSSAEELGPKRCCVIC
jgi:hypothetical protein